MVQIIITILIVASALAFGIYLTARSLRDPLRSCKGCDKTCCGCSLEDLKKNYEKKKVGKNA